MTFVEMHVKWSTTLKDLLGPEILTVLEIKGQILHRVHSQVKFPEWLSNLNELITKKFPRFLLRLNEMDPYTKGTQKAEQISNRNSFFN